MKIEYKNIPTLADLLAFNVDAYFDGHENMPQQVMHEFGEGVRIKYSDETQSNEVTSSGRGSESPKTTGNDFWKMPAMQSIALHYSAYHKDEVEAIQVEVETQVEEWKNEVQNALSWSTDRRQVLEMFISEYSKHVGESELKSKLMGYKIKKESVRYPFKTVRFFAAVKFIQWAVGEAATLSNGSSETVLPELPEPIIWQASKEKLYYIVREILCKNYLHPDTTRPQVAKWLKLMFGNLPELATIVSQIKGDNKEKFPRGHKELREVFKIIEKQLPENE